MLTAAHLTQASFFQYLIAAVHYVQHLHLMRTPKPRVHVLITCIKGFRPGECLKVIFTWRPHELTARW